ncbi:MAG: redoxin domain-containing protein [Planctomycetes bacterium]|nr:redoxin domain-containing protein [Planctomycetota bacterium]
MAAAIAVLGCGKQAVSQQQQEAPNSVDPNNPKPTVEIDAEDEQLAQVVDQHPFPRRTKAPEFGKDLTWINTGGPIRMRDLKGKFVLLDFWTYCCINCIHILPELKKLEKAYPNELVVIGVHSAKFETEKGTKNIEEAVLRYEIEHPVVNDSDHKIWNSFGVQSWPSFRMVDPEGNWVAEHSGEIKFEQLDAFLKQVIPYYKKKGLLDASPIRFDLLADKQKPTPLRFPGKVLADEPNNRLFISDSNHNRIVIVQLDGTLLATIGSGAIGNDDGSFEKASFDHPQGMVLNGDTLYVAGTKNHTIRKVDLAKKRVSTIAGTGVQARTPWPGLDKLRRNAPFPKRWVGKPKKTALSSPWALWIHKTDLYIAMAGPHQIWKMPLDESEIGPYAGNGREDIVDGPLLPEAPFDQGFASFAQPSGLASDGEWLYVADSEGSSIRAVPFDAAKEVRTVVGTSKLPFGRLFVFGDTDGKQPLTTLVRDRNGLPVRDENGEFKIKGVRLQHALGVVYDAGKIYVADTYNNKIRVVDAKSGETKTLVGTREPGSDDAAGTFDEPAGITLANGTLYVADTNNHLIRTVNIKNGKVGTLTIKGLQPPRPAKQQRRPSFAGAIRVTARPQTLKPNLGSVTLEVDLTLPLGWKINEQGPMAYLLEVVGTKGSINREALSGELTRVSKPSNKFKVSLPVKSTGRDTVKLSLNYFYCQQGGEGFCKVGSVVWTVRLNIDDGAPTTSAKLEHRISN